VIRPVSPAYPFSSAVSGTRVGDARCSTDAQDLTAQREAPLALGVEAERLYLDHGLTGTTRARPGLDQALAAVRAGHARGSEARSPGSVGA
jgi:DNA invertase Pin-like site-specific DNA recombinase